MADESGVEVLEKPKQTVVVSHDDISPEEKWNNYIKVKEEEMKTDPRIITPQNKTEET